MNKKTTTSTARPAKTWIAALLAGHSALGLSFCALIYLICLSGTLAVFEHELQRWEQPLLPIATELAPQAIDTAITQIRQKAPTDAASSITITLPTQDRPQMLVSAGGHEGKGGHDWYADGYGRLVIEARHPATSFIAELHTGLHLPLGVGTVIIGLSGMALLCLIISGTLAHARMFKDAFKLRLGGARRLQLADMHNRLGTWALPFALIISFTGAFIALFFFMFAGVATTTYRGDMGKAFADLAGPFPKHDRRPQPLPPIAPLIAQARLAMPMATMDTLDIQQPGTRGQQIGISLREANPLLAPARFVFDGDGRQIYSSVAPPFSAPQQLLLATQPVHYGWFGGLGVKIAYGLLGIVLCVVTSTGARVWLERRRDKGRPAPTFERLWIAVKWGQPLGIALAVWIALVSTGAIAPTLVWVLVSAATLLAAAFRGAQDRLDRWLRIALASVLAVVVVSHLWIWRDSEAILVSWPIDGMILISAIMVGFTLPRR
ncbi:PepSY-associated TM helix domain-containing protein [Novosphingobium sp.]|uniref:PepSY-associated TM helix domain-containing protein n=1 Tax=Novosphingobium sp. TaxID=1874826 RepID=UPI0031E053B6